MISVIRYRSKENPRLAAKAIAIRHHVFVIGQNVDPALELEYEEESHHYLLFLDQKPVAAARWRQTEKGIKLERFATLDEYRNRGFGAMLLNEVLKDVRGMGKPIYLHAQIGAVRFYEKHGFVKEGEVFYEANIGHYRMTLKI
jgi:predicted GNAT family N-acyltransferase